MNTQLLSINEILEYFENNNIKTNTAKIKFYKSQLRGWKAKYENYKDFPIIKFSYKNEDQLKHLIQQCIQWKNNNNIEKEEEEEEEVSVFELYNSSIDYYVQENDTKKPTFLSLPGI